LAVDFYCEGTELIIIPVTGGRQNPPQNKTIHSNATKAANYSRKGIGIAHNAATILTKHCTFYAFFVLYPPNFEVIIPPTTTPPTGAVKLVTVK
jgi:hypothetical protein